jgi:hypothetical protein
LVSDDLDEHEDDVEMQGRTLTAGGDAYAGGQGDLFVVDVEEGVVVT